MAQILFAFPVHMDDRRAIALVSTSINDIGSNSNRIFQWLGDTLEMWQETCVNAYKRIIGEARANDCSIWNPKFR